MIIILNLEKHLDKMMERVECNCRFITSKNNLIKYKWSYNHLKRMIDGIDLKKLKKLKNI
jgi:hypothetical protein